jgi:5'-deoxynucleotidase
MYNTQREDLMQHTLECAFVANFLANIGNSYFEKDYNTDKLTVCALFHDIPEVLTGDLPTPVKYFSDEMMTVYKQIERVATDKLKTHLPKEMRAEYSAYLESEGLTEEEKKLIKLSDKLCAYLKCIYELNVGNKEFQSAYTTIRSALETSDSEELQYFLDHFVPAFSLSLDDLKGTL